MKRRWPLYLICVVGFTGVLFTGTTAWLLGTERGTRFVLDTAAERLPITINNPSGTFLDGFAADAIMYQDDVLSLVVKEVGIAVDLWSLSSASAVEVRYVLAREVSITTKGEGSELTEIAVPLSPLLVKLERFAIGRLTFNETEILALEIVGDWSPSGIQLETLKLEVANTKVEGSVEVDGLNPQGLTGQLNWTQDGLAGQLDVTGNFQLLKIDHLLQFEDMMIASSGSISLLELPRLSLDLTHEIAAYRANVTTEISGHERQWHIWVSGTYEELPFQFEAAARSEDETWRATLSDGLLANSVAFAGEVALDASELDFVVQDLSQLDAALTGLVKGQMSHAGEVIKIESHAQSVAVDGDLTMENLSLTATYNISNQTAQAQISASSLTALQTKIDRPRVNLEGGHDHFNYRLQWPQTNLAGSGQYDRSILSLSVDQGAQLTIEENSVVLDDQLMVQLGPKQITLSQHCWSGVVAVCGQGFRSQTGALNFSGTVNAANVEQLIVLPISVEPSITVDAEWRMEGTVDALELAADGSVGAVTIRQDQLAASLPELHFAATVAGDEIQAQLDGANDHFSINGSLVLRNRTTVDGQFALTADLAGGLVLPEELELRGQVQGGLGFSGALDMLSYQGEGTWLGDFAWNDQALNEIRADWQVSDKGWRLSGQGTPTQGGYVNITGEGDGFSPSSNVTASVDGENLTIASDFWELTAAPDIDLTIRDGEIDFTGHVRVPYARAEIDTLPPSLPKPSRDVVVVGRTTDVETDALRGKVRVVLEDDVRLKLFLLDIGLSGQLDADVIGEEVTSLQGELRIPTGVLEASGQKLSITEGRVIFTGDPTNPYIDIVALREIENVTPPTKVGLRIVGLSDELTTTLYSEPRMSESRTLSFLVTGRDLASPSDAETNYLLNAAIGFGIKQSAGVVQELRERVGLDELTALSNEQNEVAIVAGKQITEDLHVRYTYNALSAIGALVIRYHLSDRWRLEASNDQTSSMDLLYEFSK